MSDYPIYNSANRAAQNTALRAKLSGVPKPPSLGEALDALYAKVLDHRTKTPECPPDCWCELAVPVVKGMSRLLIRPTGVVLNFLGCVPESHAELYTEARGLIHQWLNCLLDPINNLPAEELVFRTLFFLSDFPQVSPELTELVRFTFDELMALEEARPGKMRDL